MQTFFYRNLVSMLLAVLALAVAALLPFGGSASAATSICPPGDGGPNCDLAISAPDSVASGQPFTVQVALGVVTEGGFTLLPKGDLCASNVVVTLKVFITEGPPFATYTANAKKGVATFDVGGLPAGEGPYSAQLAASAVQTTGYCSYFNEYLPVLVVNVPAGQPIAPCPNDVVCTQVTSHGGTAATLFTDTGNGSFSPLIDNTFFVTLAAAEGVVGGNGCGGPGPRDPNGVLGWTFSGGSPNSKTVIFALSPSLVNTDRGDEDDGDDRGTGHIKTCWNGNDGQGWQYLHHCSNKVGPPCIAHKKLMDDKGALITISAPPNGDPWAYEE